MKRSTRIHGSSTFDIPSGRVTAGDALSRIAGRDFGQGPHSDENHRIRAIGQLGHLVREARQSRKLSQQNFADLAGVGRRFLSELENGKPTLEFDKVLKTATAAGVDLFAKKRR